MAGHTVTLYELTATRKYARDKAKKDEPLLLASLSDTTAVDLLDLLEVHLTGVDGLTYSNQTTTLSCSAVRRDGDSIGMVFANDVSGEWEIVHDGDDPLRPVVFLKGDKHVTRYYSCCMLWRPATGTSGLLLVHSPWSRGGSRGSILKMIQKAVDVEKAAKAKLTADAMVPARALERILKQANATRITYSKSAGVRSTFGAGTTQQSAPAEMDLVVKGSDSLPFRDALAGALKATANRDKLFTIRVRDEAAADGYREETFDDVEIDIETAGGSKKYSMRKDTIPTVSYNLTPQVNNVYYGLPDDDGASWPSGLLDGMVKHLQKIVSEANADRA